MKKRSSEDFDRWEELQVARLLEGLSADEQAEYDRLAEQLPVDQQESFDSVVAALDLAWGDPHPEPLPEHLKQAVRAQSRQVFGDRSAQPSGDAPPRAVPPVMPVRRAAGGESSTFRLRDAVPWLVSAACLLVAVGVWLVHRPSADATPDLAQRRSELIASSDQLVRATWSEGTTPIEGASGDIVWSPSRQEGFMQFRGLPVNTPTEEQYQLWIFDKNQSEATPIDGGVFDISSPGEVIVPIDAKLPVEDVYMFAVTIEKPGGVVVSSRERLPLLAKVE